VSTFTLPFPSANVGVRASPLDTPNKTKQYVSHCFNRSSGIPEMRKGTESSTGLLPPLSAGSSIRLAHVQICRMDPSRTIAHRACPGTLSSILNISPQLLKSNNIKFTYACSWLIVITPSAYLHYGFLEREIHALSIQCFHFLTTTYILILQSEFCSTGFWNCASLRSEVLIISGPFF
jgi:hypothetical protein